MKINFIIILILFAAIFYMCKEKEISPQNDKPFIKYEADRIEVYGNHDDTTLVLEGGVKTEMAEWIKRYRGIMPDTNIVNYRIAVLLIIDSVNKNQTNENHFNRSNVNPFNRSNVNPFFFVQ